MKHLLQLILSLFIIALASCSKDNNDIIDPTNVERTLLVYLAGDNNLSHEVKEMHDALLKGWNHKTMGPLIIFADHKQSSPLLIKLENRNGQNVSDTLRRYAIENSASAQLLKQVINDTKVVAPNKNYGMVLFSHATGWLPEKAFVNPSRWGTSSGNNEFQIAPLSIFEDNGREMELTDFASAIPDGMFHFMAFDMCFMSSVETIYALRNKTEYMIAAAPEILAPGFTPLYSTSLDKLYKSEPDLKGFADAFYNYFNGLQGAFQSAAISVISTSQIEALAAKTREIAPTLTQEQIDKVQYYDRNGKPHVFFDFGDYIKQVATQKQSDELASLLDKVILFKRNTPKLIDISITKHSGLSVYIPQSTLPELNKAYEKTDWWKAIQ